MHSCSRMLVIPGHLGWGGSEKQSEIFLPYWTCLIFLPYWKFLLNFLPIGEAHTGICWGLVLEVLTYMRTNGCLPSTVTMDVAAAKIWAIESRILSSAQGIFFFLYHWHVIREHLRFLLCMSTIYMDWWIRKHLKNNVRELYWQPQLKKEQMWIICSQKEERNENSWPCLLTSWLSNLLYTRMST